MRSRYHRPAAALAAVVLLLGSASMLTRCGGSSGTLPSESLLPGGTGSLEITVEQPGVRLGSPQGAAGRFVPPNTLSVKAFVFVEGEQNPNAFQTSGTANLPAPVVLSNVPAGPKDIRVWAYDASNGTGNAVAYGVAQVLLLGGRNNSVTVPLQAGRLIFASERDGNIDLYRTTPDGRLTTRLTFSAELTTEPAPSPNGQKIAYAEKVGDWEIRVLDNATLAVTVFADLPGHDTTPAWSPDSNTIVWVNNNAGTYTLQKKNLDGSGAASLSFGASPISRPSWSPDGSRIALQYWDGADYEIGVMWANLGSFTAVTNDSFNQLNPVWSRDGSSIYCSSADSDFYFQLAQLTGNLYPGGSAYVSLMTDEPWSHYLSDISPDGALLACRAIPPWIGNWDIYYYSADPYSDEGRIRVTYNSSWDGSAAFLPPTTGGGPVTYE